MGLKFKCGDVVEEIKAKCNLLSYMVLKISKKT